MLVTIALLIIGLVLLAYGADRLVFSASIRCRSPGVPPLIIGITVVSMGASLPELFVSSFAAQQGQPDTSVGTTTGSNIINYNLAIVPGLPALLHAGTGDSSAFAHDYRVMPGVSALFMLICLQRRRIGRVAEILLVSGFILRVLPLWPHPSESFW